MTSTALPAFHSPKLGPHIFCAPLLCRLDCPRHRTGSIRSWVTVRRIKEHAISDEWPSQFILVVVTFDINVQVRPATPQVDWLRTREYRMSGSARRMTSVQQPITRARRLPINGRYTHCRITDASRTNWSTFLATSSSVSNSSSSLLVEPHLAKNITRMVIAHIRVMTRSRMLNGDFQNCYVPSRKARKPP